EFMEFKAARVVFWLSALWMWGGIVWWGINTPTKFVPRAAIVLVAWGLIGVGLTEALRLTAKRESRRVAHQSSGTTALDIGGNASENTTTTPASMSNADVPAKPLSTPAPGTKSGHQPSQASGAANEAKRRRELLDKLRNEYILSHDNL